MVTREILEKAGVTPEAWKKKLEFTRTPQTSPDPLKPVDEMDVDDRLKRLHHRIRSRVQRGRDYNMANYRTIQALDLVWEAPFRQITPTLLSDLIRNHKMSDGDRAQEQLRSALNSIGLGFDEIMYDTEERDPKTQAYKKAFNVPAFFNVIVPLVRAYLEIRRAKIVNDRNLKPFHKFESPVSDELQRLKCEIITSRIEAMRQDYGYLDVLKQAVFQMLLYGTCIQFTLEAWHFEEQKKYASKEDVEREANKEEDSKTISEGDELVYTSKEGLRYYHPHPSRMFYDQAYPAWTFNTDTGCEYAGYWRIIRYKEVLDNPDFYNKDRLNYSATAWWTSNVNFFNAVYNSCVLAWPDPVKVPDGQDREKYLATNSVYNETLSDKSICITEYRERIIPSEYGLGNYDYPIWARFVLAGDDSTIIYAEPLCYPAVVCYRYNGDDRKTEDASLGLQLLPSQDMLSNLLSQFIYAAKQNLTNITLVDENVVSPTIWKKITNLGERLIRGLNIFKFDSKVLQRMQASPQQAFYSHRFPQLDTNGILQSIKLILDLAERVLQFSNQEVAQAASHEQTRKEVEMIMGSTTNVLQFTGVPVDAAMAAQAKQLYEALMNYGDDDFYAMIPLDHNISQKELEDLGITYVWTPKPQSKRAMVRVRKSAVELRSFAVVPSYYERANNVDQARAISEMVRDWFINNPIGQSALGPDQLTELFNLVSQKLLVLPLDRPIKNVGMTTEQQNQVAQQQLQSMGHDMMKQTKEGMIPILQEVQTLTQAVANLYQQLHIPPPQNAGANQTPPQAGGNQPNPGIPG